MRIDVYSHSFEVKEVSGRQKEAVEHFCRSLVQYEFVKEDGIMKRKPARVFASAFKDRRYYRFHVNLLDDFLKMLAYYQIANKEFDKHIHTADIRDEWRVEFEIKSLYNPRDQQPVLIDHVMNPGSNKIINLQTGAGKTLITKHVIKNLGLRTVGIMKGGFIDRWVPDLEDTFKFKRGELLVVRGGQSLNAIMEMALENEFSNVTCVMMSINTYSEYLKDYEENGLSDQYPIAPGQFFQRMGFGFGFLDEGHQNPHQVMKMFSYMHVHKFLTLSATLDTQDKFMTRMYEVMYPREDRFNAGFYRVYIRVKGIRYQIRRPKAIRYKGFGGAYSHTAFEASLMRDKNRVELKNYIDLIMWTLKTNFLDVMEKGQKAIIFCGTIKFCTLLTKYLQQQIRHLKVVRYVGADKMSVLNDGEIIVSTVLSAGTAVDIPNLRVGIMTTAVDSQQSNEQTMGRTRPLKDWPDVDPYFVFFVCSDIPQHVKYGQNKEGFFKNKVKSFGYEQAPISV